MWFRVQKTGVQRLLSVVLTSMIVSSGWVLADGGGGCGASGGMGCEGSAEVSFDTDFWKEEMTTTVYLAGFRFRMNQNLWGCYPAEAAVAGPAFLGRFIGETVLINVYRVEEADGVLAEAWRLRGWRELSRRRVMTTGGVKGLKSTWANGSSSVTSRITMICQNDEGERILFDARPSGPGAQMWRAEDFLMDQMATGRPLATSLWDLLTLPFRGVSRDKS